MIGTIEAPLIISVMTQNLLFGAVDREVGLLTHFQESGAEIFALTEANNQVWADGLGFFAVANANFVAGSATTSIIS